MSGIILRSPVMIRPQWHHDAWHVRLQPYQENQRKNAAELKAIAPNMKDARQTPSCFFAAQPECHFI